MVRRQKHGRPFQSSPNKALSCAIVDRRFVTVAMSQVLQASLDLDDERADPRWRLVAAGVQG